MILQKLHVWWEARMESRVSITRLELGVWALIPDGGDGKGAIMGSRF